MNAREWLAHFEQNRTGRRAAVAPAVAVSRRGYCDGASCVCFGGAPVVAAALCAAWVCADDRTSGRRRPVSPIGRQLQRPVSRHSCAQTALPGGRGLRCVCYVAPDGR